MVTEPAQAQAPKVHWFHKFSSILLIIFCAEVGLFLLLYPWSDKWDQNFFASLLPRSYWIWKNAYVRGAVSGLGILNLYISIGEIFRLFRRGEPVART